MPLINNVSITPGTGAITYGSDPTSNSVLSSSSSGSLTPPNGSVPLIEGVNIGNGAGVYAGSSVIGNATLVNYLSLVGANGISVTTNGFEIIISSAANSTTGAFTLSNALQLATLTSSVDVQATELVTVNSNISTEITRATTAESVISANTSILTTAVNLVNSNAIANVITLTNSISTEVTRATTAEAVVSANTSNNTIYINLVNSNVINNVSSLTNSITAETTRAVAAENVLNSNISTLALNMTNQFSVVNSNAATEVTRAKSSESIISANVTNLMSEITVSGTNVGINTTTPHSPLDINGFLHLFGSTQNYTSGQGSYINWNIQVNGETDFINQKGAGNGGFAFYDSGSTSTPANSSMFIDTNKNFVGINKLNKPLSFLHIFDTTTIPSNGQILLQSQGGGSQIAAIQFQVTAITETTNALPKAGIAFQRTASNGSGNLTIYNRTVTDTNPYGTSASDAMMVFNQTGNISVNTSMNVSGAIQIGTVWFSSGVGAPTVATPGYAVNGSQYNRADGTLGARVYISTGAAWISIPGV